MEIIIGLLILFSPLIPVALVLGLLFWIDGRRDKARIRQQLWMIENEHRARDRELWGSGPFPPHLQPIRLEDVPHD